MVKRKRPTLYTTLCKDGTKPSIPLPSTTVNGVPISLEQIRKIRADLLSGAHPQLAAIARRNGVSRSYIRKLLDNDPELRVCYEDALSETAEQIEKAAVDMCLNDEVNPIAREKMIEFVLPKMMPDRYGECAGMSDAAKSLPRINVSLTLPVVEKHEEIIQVHSESPLNDKPTENAVPQ